jgi:hypothetical protein
MRAAHIVPGWSSRKQSGLLRASLDSGQRRRRVDRRAGAGVERWGAPAQTGFAPRWKKPSHRIEILYKSARRVSK